jgi:hypothetical protein
MSPCRLKAARLKGFITIAWLKCAAATPKAPTQRALLQALARFGRALAKKLMLSSVHEVPQCTGRTFYPLE